MMKGHSTARFMALVLLALLAALILSSCGAYGDNDSAFPGNAIDDYYPGEDGSRDKGEQDPSIAPPGQGGAVGDSDIRYIIRNGSLSLTVRDTRGTVETIRGIVTSVNGIISGSYIYEIREGQYAANLTLRIPASQFDPILLQLQELGKAAEINTNDSDVTMQYVELDARIENLRVQEQRLREILEMADSVEDILRVEYELMRVRGDIEAMTAQFKYLQDQVAYSTIMLYIREEYIATQTISPAPFENLGARIKEALVRSVNFMMRAFAALLVGVTAALPVLLVLAVIIWVLVVLIRRRRKRKIPAA